MQPTVLRRVSRRTQPDRFSVGLLHSSTSAESAAGKQLSADYLGALRDTVRLAQVEEDGWVSGTLSIAQQARDSKAEARRLEADEARQRIAQQRQEQELVLAQRDDERRARAAEAAERLRRERERARREREEEQQQRRAGEEAHRRAIEEAERQRRERLRPCVICMDENDFSILAQLRCTHWTCRSCLRDGFEASFAARSRFQCCQQHVPVSTLADVLPNDFVSRYELMVLEQTTPNPTFCANTACASFIPPANYEGPDMARCDRCNTETCRHCRTMSHQGRGCTADTATEQVRALAAVVGWKTCPACGTMVERRDGCLHMSCRCGAEFCYRCGGYWRNCSTRCGGQYF